MDGVRHPQAQPSVASWPGFDRNPGLAQPGHVAFHGAVRHVQLLGEPWHSEGFRPGGQEFDDALLPFDPPQGQVRIARRRTESLSRQSGFLSIPTPA